MEPTDTKSESDSSWDLDDRCLDDLINDEDDPLPKDCVGYLDELKSINSVHSGDTEELLGNLPKNLSASVPKSMHLLPHLQKTLDLLYANTTYPSYNNKSRPPAPTSNANRAHPASPLPALPTSKQPLVPNRILLWTS
jgi:hypothetical protein